MESIIEILDVTTVIQNTIYLKKKVRERFGFKEGKKLALAINKQGQVVILKAEMARIY